MRGANPAKELGGVAQALQKQKNWQDHLRLAQEQCTAAGNGVGDGATGNKLLDQSQSLTAIQSGLLAQLQAVEQRARASSGGQAAGDSGSVPGKALDPAKLLALGKDCLRVVVLSLGFALAFAAAAQRKGTPVSLLAEWSLAAKRVVKACRFWKQQRRTERQQQGKPSPPSGSRSNARNRGIDANYFETLAGEQEDKAGN